ncbi:hypothetical protein KIW84_UN0762 [Lathyrus oleraceus]|nr:hypothetical protein KIW84_UN0762 [Pisum sativum]
MPGEEARKARSQSVPDRHAATALAAGAAQAVHQQPTGSELGPPCQPSEQSFSEVTDPFCRLPCLHCSIDRGCSPWRPDAVRVRPGMEGTRSSGFSRAARGHRTPRDVRCSSSRWTLPRLSRFQVGRLYNGKDNSFRGPANVSGLPNVAVSHHGPGSGILTRFPFGIGTDDRSAQARALGFAADRRALLLIRAWPLPQRTPGIGRALLAHPFSGLVDSAVGHRNQLPVIPHRSSAYQKWPTWSSRFHGMAQQSSHTVPTYLKFENRSRALRPDASNHWLYESRTRPRAPAI